MVTGFTGVKATVHISSTSTNPGNGADLADTVRIFAALNGGAFPGTADITVTGAAANNSSWGYNNTINDTTAAGTPISVAGTTGTDTGTIHSTLEITVPDGTTSVALRIIALNDNPNEIWNVDDVTLTSTPFCPTPTPTATPTATPTPTPTTGDVCQVFDFESGAAGFTVVAGNGTPLWHLANNVCGGGAAGHTTPTTFYYGVEPGCNYETGGPNASDLISSNLSLSGGGPYVLSRRRRISHRDR